MAEITVWHTPRILLTEYSDRLTGYRVEITLPHIMSVGHQTISTIGCRIRDGTYKGAPRHYFVEDVGALSYYEVAYYIENEDREKERVVDGYAKAHHMYMVTSVNTDPESFGKLAILRQYMECTHSLDFIRPGAAELIAAKVKEAVSIKYQQYLMFKKK